MSTSISNLVSHGNLDLIKSSRNNLVPSHIFYADDILILCIGKLFNINALKKIFQDYSMVSSQCFNLEKSYIYYEFITEFHINRIINNTGFSKGTIPFSYLGILIFTGRVKLSRLSHIFGRIFSKLSSWKVSFLSMVGRLTLIKYIIQGMIYYTINIYSWHVSLLRKIERACRNFLWSTDINKRNLFMVAWKKTCQLYINGGLSICFLVRLNEATNLKILWNLRAS